MGRFGCSGWHSVRDVHSEILMDSGPAVVAHRATCYGRRLWVVYEGHDETRFITLFLIEGKPGVNLTYKPMPEDSHPYFYDCPLDLLLLAPNAISPESEEWRNNVREYHEEYRKVYERDEIVRYKGISQEFAIVEKRKKSYIGRDTVNGKLYKLSPHRILKAI